MWLGIICGIVLLLLASYQVVGLIKDIKERKQKKQNKDHVEEVSTDKGSDNK